ncbi:DUF7511 domain-containing protein [Natronomonas moolapensis]
MNNTGPERTRPSWDGAETPGPSESPRSGLIALVVGPAKRPACTIFPPDVAVPYRTTTWITAHGDSFVNLEEYR